MKNGSSGSDRRLLAAVDSMSKTLISNDSSDSSSGSTLKSNAAGDDGDDHDWDSREASDGVVVDLKKDEMELYEDDGDAGREDDALLGEERREAGAD